MKSISTTAILGLALWGGFSLMTSAFQSEGLAPKTVHAEEDAAKSASVLRHVVLFKFKASVSKEQIQEVVDAFAALPKKIDAIKGFEWGTDVSVENKAAGYTHGFIVTFASEKGRDEYLPHPDHKEFGKLVGPRLDGVLVFDFWAKDK